MDDVTRKLAEALCALLVRPDQYCCCPAPPEPGAPRDEHTGECADAREALIAAGMSPTDVVGVAPDGDGHTSRKVLAQETCVENKARNFKESAQVVQVSGMVILEKWSESSSVIRSQLSSPAHVCCQEWLSADQFDRVLAAVLDI